MYTFIIKKWVEINILFSLFESIVCSFQKMYTYFF